MPDVEDPPLPPFSVVAASGPESRSSSRASVRRLARALALLPSPALLVDLSGGVRYANAAARRLLGLPRLHARPVRLLDLVHPDEAARARRRLGRLLAGHTDGDSMLVRFRAHGGAACMLELRARRLPGAGEAAPFAVLSITDRSRLHALEVRLRESHAANALALITASASHELRSLLMAIRLDLQAAHVALPVTQRDRLLATLDRSALLVRELLDAARTRRIRTRCFDLVALLRELGERLPKVLGDAYPLTLELVPTAAPVLGDTSLTEQAVRSLVANAVAAMPTGGAIRLRVRIDQAARPDAGRDEGVVQLDVEDEGPGVDAELLEALADPCSTALRGDGTGVGLCIVDRIVRGMDGTLALRTRASHGMVASIRLPLAHGDVGAEVSVTGGETGGRDAPGGRRTAGAMGPRGPAVPSAARPADAGC